MVSSRSVFARCLAVGGALLTSCSLAQHKASIDIHRTECPPVGECLGERFEFDGVEYQLTCDQVGSLIATTELASANLYSPDKPFVIGRIADAPFPTLIAHRGFCGQDVDVWYLAMSLDALRNAESVAAACSVVPDGLTEIGRDVLRPGSPCG